MDWCRKFASLTSRPPDRPGTCVRRTAVPRPLHYSTLARNAVGYRVERRSNQSSFNLLILSRTFLAYASASGAG